MSLGVCLPMPVNAYFALSTSGVLSLPSLEVKGVGEFSGWKSTFGELGAAMSITITRTLLARWDFSTWVLLSFLTVLWRWAASPTIDNIPSRGIAFFGIAMRAMPSIAVFFTGAYATLGSLSGRADNSGGDFRD